MKYIITKDGISVRKGGNCAIIEDFIAIKQADTIEELCDEFVVIYNNGYINQYTNEEMANEDETPFEFVRNSYLRFHKEEHIVKVYGAIWTDKGLIYVAKMNEKGELELL